MKIGIQNNAYTRRYGWQEGVRLLAEDGWQCIDYQGFVRTEDALFAMGGEAFDRTIREQRAMLAARGIAVSQTHGPWRYPPHDYTVWQREERLEKSIRALHGTALLGCDAMVMHPLMPFGPGENPEPELFMQINIAFFRRLLAEAAQVGVTVCLENMPMGALPLARPEEILRFVQAMDSPFFRVCLDTGHSAVLGITPGDAVRQLGRYLQVLHVHDNDGKRDLHWLPYAGCVDWEDFAAALQEVGFDGTVSVETEVPEKMPEVLRRPAEQNLARTALYLAGRL